MPRASAFFTTGYYAVGTASLPVRLPVFRIPRDVTNRFKHAALTQFALVVSQGLGG